MSQSSILLVILLSVVHFPIFAAIFLSVIPIVDDEVPFNHFVSEFYTELVNEYFLNHWQIYTHDGKLSPLTNVFEKSARATARSHFGKQDDLHKVRQEALLGLGLDPTLWELKTTSVGAEQKPQTTSHSSWPSLYGHGQQKEKSSPPPVVPISTDWKPPALLEKFLTQGNLWNGNGMPSGWLSILEKALTSLIKFKALAHGPWGHGWSLAHFAALYPEKTPRPAESGKQKTAINIGTPPPGDKNLIQQQNKALKAQLRRIPGIRGWFEEHVGFMGQDGQDGGPTMLDVFLLLVVFFPLQLWQTQSAFLDRFLAVQAEDLRPWFNDANPPAAPGGSGSEQGAYDQNGARSFLLYLQGAVLLVSTVPLLKNNALFSAFGRRSKHVVRGLFSDDPKDFETIRGTTGGENGKEVYFRPAKLDSASEALRGAQDVLEFFNDKNFAKNCQTKKISAQTEIQIFYLVMENPLHPGVRGRFALSRVEATVCRGGGGDVK